MRSILDPGIIASVLMLVAWAVRTYLFGAPGWWHALLTFGVFLLIWRIVVRGTPAPAAPSTTGAGTARRDPRRS
jgi:hypothetical protein